ncbi:MAG: hypothetical protein IT368_02370, partial [Candidatus Hydrogenedentes bacterium]|nr:hypothetical protein [Candidatus Hydrogenedentota bacterium]
MTAFHKVRGHTLEEAYRKMRRRFGADAIVVRTATVSEGGILGFFGRKMIEVTASVPEAPGQQQRPLSAVERKYRDQPPAMTGSDTIHFYEQLVRDAQNRMKAPATPRPSPYAGREHDPARPAVHGERSEVMHQRPSGQDGVRAVDAAASGDGSSARPP